MKCFRSKKNKSAARRFRMAASYYQSNKNDNKERRSRSRSISVSSPSTFQKQKQISKPRLVMQISFPHTRPRSDRSQYLAAAGRRHTEPPLPSPRLAKSKVTSHAHNARGSRDNGFVFIELAGRVRGKRKKKPCIPSIINGSVPYTCYVPDGQDAYSRGSMTWTLF